MSNSDQFVYFDHNGTSPVSTTHYYKVVEKLLNCEGNPSSTHFFGQRARRAVDESREAVSQLIACKQDELYFTGGASESNNTVIKGVCHHSKNTDHQNPPTVIVSEAEHSSVINSAVHTESQDLCNLKKVGVDKFGKVDPKETLELIDSDTRLISLIYVNNETGIINPVKEIAKLVKEENPGIHVHIDGVQALGKIDCTWIGDSLIDSASFSGHKLASFKGIGVLYIREGNTIHPLIDGGGQESGMRAGTENLQGIVSLGLRANEILGDPHSLDHVTEIWSYLFDQLEKRKDIRIHTHREFSVKNTINFHIENVDPSIVNSCFNKYRIAVSKGSACSSSSLKPSRVLLAMGYSKEVAMSSIRVSLGWNSTMDEANYFLRCIEEIIER